MTPRRDSLTHMMTGFAQYAADEPTLFQMILTRNIQKMALSGKSCSKVPRPLSPENKQCGSERHNLKCKKTENDSVIEFKVVSEDVSYQKYLTLYDVEIEFPAIDGASAVVHNFDVIGHPRANFRYCVAVPFHQHHSRDWRKGEMIVLREFAQGNASMCYCFPTGAFDPRKHTTLLDCAKAELSEEAHLQSDTWIPLLSEANLQSEVKWCRNKFQPWLCIDPETELNPGVRDVEEAFIEVHRMSITELRKLAKSGKMLLPSVATLYWALDWLEENL